MTAFWTNHAINRSPIIAAPGKRSLYICRDSVLSIVIIVRLRIIVRIIVIVRVAEIVNTDSGKTGVPIPIIVPIIAMMPPITMAPISMALAGVCVSKGSSTRRAMDDCGTRTVAKETTMVKFQQRYQMRHRNSRSEDLCRGLASAPASPGPMRWFGK